MTFARDLLDQANQLADKEPRRPKQASLRRSVSTAYYAIFHLLVQDAANALAPSAPSGLRTLIQRAFAHAQIKTACKELVEANTVKLKNPRNQTKLHAALEKLVTFPLEPDLVTVLNAFVELQEARHKADYDLSEHWIRLEALNNLDLAEQAFAAWSAVRRTPNAAVFVSSLAFRKDWGR